MTDQEMQSSILSALGWVPEFVPSNKEIAAAKDGTGQYEGAAGYPIGSGPLGGMQATWWKNPKGEFETPPDYLNDLNAIREAENVLTEDQQERMMERLHYLVRDDWSKRMLKTTEAFEWCICHSTARQRAEAFLKTLGKWKE